MKQENVYKKPTQTKGTCYTKNKLAIQYDLHIIIPAYNAEKYIKECLESVFIQVSEYSVLATRC